MPQTPTTTGKRLLGDIAPAFADLNDRVLEDEVWAREAQLSRRDRSLITISALMASGVYNDTLKGHVRRALKNGVTREELIETVTQLAFYTGWPRAWAVFYVLKDVFAELDSRQGADSLRP